MILTWKQMDAAKGVALAHLNSIKQTWLARLLEASICEFSEIESAPLIIGGKTVRKLSAKVLIPGSFSNIVPRLSTDILKPYLMAALNAGLEKHVSAKDETLAIYELYMEWGKYAAESGEKLSSISSHDKTGGYSKAITLEVMRFQSDEEMLIAKELDRAMVILFPNFIARLNMGSGVAIRETCFLVCCDGKWGILEVDGLSHAASSRERIGDHSRDGLFKSHGIKVIEHVTAGECRSNPQAVVSEFLELVRKS